MKEKLKGQGLEADAMKPEELAALFKSETAKWAKVIRDAKISAE
jgi:tripartite-type tricarboxylate transporter receptor subunit TctC